MRILVIGGAGFIGSHLVEELVAKDHQVTIVDDLSNGTYENLKTVRENISFLEADVSKPFFYKPLYERNLLDFNIIYYLACWPRSRSFDNPTRDIEVNLIGMVNTLELARMIDAKVIFSSNSGIYDTSKIPIDEQTSDRPLTPYDLDKKTSEEYMKLYAEAYGVEFVIFRFASVYGSRQRVTEEWKPVVIEFINKLTQGKAPTINWDGFQTRDLINVKDIVSALVLTLESKEAIGETMILGSGVETSINTLYKTICNYLEVDIEPKRGPKTPGDIRKMQYNCSKSRRILGWKAQISLNDGIKQIIQGE